MSEPRYILYVNKSYKDDGALCTGSQRCLASLAQSSAVDVQNVDDLLADHVELPPWLDATPCLVDTNTSTASKGRAAVEACAAIGEEAHLDTAQSTDSDRELPKVTEADVQRILQARSRQDKHQPKPAHTLPKPIDTKKGAA